MLDKVPMHYKDRKRAEELKEQIKDQKYKESRLANKVEETKNINTNKMESLSKENIGLNNKESISKREEVGKSPKVSPIDPLVLENIFKAQKKITTETLLSFLPKESLDYTVKDNINTEDCKNHPTLASILFTTDLQVYLSKLISKSESSDNLDENKPK